MRKRFCKKGKKEHHFHELVSNILISIVVVAPTQQERLSNLPCRMAEEQCRNNPSTPCGSFCCAVSGRRCIVVCGGLAGRAPGGIAGLETHHRNQAKSFHKTPRRPSSCQVRSLPSCHFLQRQWEAASSHSFPFWLQRRCQSPSDSQMVDHCCCNGSLFPRRKEGFFCFFVSRRWMNSGSCAV